MGNKSGSFFKEKVLLGKSWGEYISGLLTPWNLVAGIIIIFGLYAIIYRLLFGLGPATNLSDEYPWGIWIAFDILVGIALAAPGLAVATSIHLFGFKDYHSFARPAVLSSLVGYVFAVTALLFDLGRYYRVYYPIIWSWGLTSVLFLIGWHFFLYIIISIVEWLPAFFEWTGLRKAQEIFSKLAIWATALGVIIAGGHQSALGALFLIVPEKLHPLWYSPLLPLFFLVSALFGGVAIVTIESSISHRAFEEYIPHEEHEVFPQKLLGLAKAMYILLILYLLLKILDLIHYHKVVYLLSPYGYWYLVETIGFVVLPILILANVIKYKWSKLVPFIGVWVALGVILNRFNVCLIAYKWYIPLSQKYYPSWMEVALSLCMVVFIIITTRFMLRRLPILPRKKEA